MQPLLKRDHKNFFHSRWMHLHAKEQTEIEGEKLSFTH